MAIVTSDHPYKDYLGSECFYCSGPVQQHGIMWMGATGELLLHPHCVIELFLRLGRDGWALECQTGHSLAMSDPVELRTRLVTEEMTVLP